MLGIARGLGGGVCVRDACDCVSLCSPCASDMHRNVLVTVHLCKWVCVHVYSYVYAWVYVCMWVESGHLIAIAPSQGRTDGCPFRTVQTRQDW